EPDPFQVRIEEGAGDARDRQLAVDAARAQIVDGLLLHDRRDVAAADRGLRHRGRVDVELQRGAASLQHVGFEAWWNVEHESISAYVHREIDRGAVDLFGGPEVGFEQTIVDACGQ